MHTLRWPRRRTLRRLAATALVLLAAALALRPSHPQTTTTPMLVAAHDLAAGTTLRATDVAVVHLSPEFRPRAALTRPREAVGRVLAGATTTGEPVTRARLLGGTLDPTTAAVPFRLADPAVAALLTPGARVDVVTVTPNAGEPLVLATNATILTVREARESSTPDGHLVVIALPREEAARVAGASLSQPVAVTLR
jgi:pilus assembly protein CpaB